MLKKTHYSFDIKNNEGLLDNFPFQNKKVNIYDKISDSNNKIINLVYNNKNLGTENFFYKERKYKLIKKPKIKTSLKNYFLFNSKLFNKKPTMLTQNSINESINNLTDNFIKNNKNERKKKFYKTLNPSQLKKHRRSSLSLASLDEETLKFINNKFNNNNKNDNNENKNNSNENLPLFMKLNKPLQKLMVDDNAKYTNKREGTIITDQKDIIQFLTELKKSQSKSENIENKLYYTDNNIFLDNNFRKIYDKCKKEITKNENLENYLKNIKKNNFFNNEYLKKFNTFKTIISNNDDAIFLNQENNQFLINKNKQKETFLDRLNNLDKINKLSNNFAYEDRKKFFKSMDYDEDAEKKFLFKEEHRKIRILEEQKEKNKYKYSKKNDKIFKIVDRMITDNKLLNNKLNDYIIKSHKQKIYNQNTIY